MLSVMDSENGNDSKQNPGDDRAVDEGNEPSQRSRTHSEVSAVNEMGSTAHHSESHLRPSSSSSTSSKDFQEVNASKEINSTSDELEMSPTQSPPVQVMERNGGYDPNRIPSSVFERSKSNIPAEWSSASNESLFSIHLGNNSFSVYGDFTKSGELYKSGELLAYSPALPLAPPMKNSNGKTADSDEKQVEASAKVVKENKEKTGEHPAVSWKSPTTSYRSNKSANSTHSFSFPILAEGVTSEAAKAEEQNKRPVRAPSEANQNQASNRWFPCLPPCPWCCSSHSSCSSCSCS